MTGKILVIRDGAIGDFILTLPAIRLLRQAFPDAQVDILGRYPIVRLVEERYYAEHTRSIDAAPLAGFFHSNAELDSTWCNYFAGFQKVLSYLHDPDETFVQNLRRAGVKEPIISGSPKIKPGLHAAYQLAQPLESLGLFLKDPAPCLFPSEADQRALCDLFILRGIRKQTPFIAVHPGSGGKYKNWPLSYWEDFCHWILQNFPQYSLFCVGGEADVSSIRHLFKRLHSSRLTFLENLPLPSLAALLSKAHAFVGHDTGVSHIAAAAGARCLLLYGPTDPKTWAPTSPCVRVLTSPTGIMEDLSIQTVLQAFDFL